MKVPTYYFEVGTAEAINIHAIIINDWQCTELMLLKFQQHIFNELIFRRADDFPKMIY